MTQERLTFKPPAANQVVVNLMIQRPREEYPDF
jgi:hypothetical protein